MFHEAIQKIIAAHFLWTTVYSAICCKQIRDVGLLNVLKHIIDNSKNPSVLRTASIIHKVHFLITWLEM